MFSFIVLSNKILIFVSASHMCMKLSKFILSVYFVEPLVVKACKPNAIFFQDKFQVILSRFDFLERGQGANIGSCIGSCARSKVKTYVRGQRSRLQLKENALKNIAHILFKKDKIVEKLNMKFVENFLSVSFVATLAVEKIYA